MPGESGKKPPKSRRKNYKLNKQGLMRYSSSMMYGFRAGYKLSTKTPKKEKPKDSVFKMITKPIGGEKNGETRTVPVNRLPRYYPTSSKKPRTRSKGKGTPKKPKLRASITPGTILILLCGPHKGKRVIFLKQLDSGLLLVTGPFKYNSCPMRRISQAFVIATKTKIDTSSVNLPEHLTDDYFKRKKEKKQAGEGEIFDTEKEVYAVSEQRKNDQVEVDQQVIKAIKEREDRALMKKYLMTPFSLRGRQYPHKMVF